MAGREREILANWRRRVARIASSQQMAAKYRRRGPAVGRRQTPAMVVLRFSRRDAAASGVQADRRLSAKQSRMQRRKLGARACSLQRPPREQANCRLQSAYGGVVNSRVYTVGPPGRQETARFTRRRYTAENTGNQRQPLFGTRCWS